MIYDKKVKDIISYPSWAILRKIATNKGNTNAWISATSNHWAYKINGPIRGNHVAKILWNKLLTPATKSPSKIPHANIFPYNLAVNEIAFAQIPIISKNPTNNEIAISKSLTISLSG